MLPNQNKKLEKDIESWKETFPDIPITRNGDYEVRIKDQNFTCILTFRKDWPFSAPGIKILGYATTRWFTLKTWNPVTDFRAIYAEVLENLESDPIFYVDKQIPSFKEKFPGSKVSFDSCNGRIEYDEFKITFNSKNIFIYENGREWRMNIRPSIKNPLNLIDIMSQVNDIRVKLTWCTPSEYIDWLSKSLLNRFENVTYNRDHQTFIVDSPQGLLIIGIVPTSPYLEPVITMYYQGDIVDSHFDLSNWNSDCDLGEIIVNTEGF